MMPTERSRLVLGIEVEYTAAFRCTEDGKWYPAEDRQPKRRFSALVPRSCDHNHVQSSRFPAKGLEGGHQQNIDTA